VYYAVLGIARIILWFHIIKRSTSGITIGLYKVVITVSVYINKGGWVSRILKEKNTFVKKLTNTFFRR